MPESPSVQPEETVSPTVHGMPDAPEHGARRRPLGPRKLPSFDRPWRRTLAAAAALILTASASAARADRRAQPSSPTHMAPAQATQRAPGVVNLNTATDQELMRLPGIGPSRAQAILMLRERIGRFRRLAQLLRVRGIGRKTFRRLRPYLTLEGATTLAHSPRPRR